MERIVNIVKTLMGYANLPKSYRNMLKRFGDAKIERIEVCRTPLSGIASVLLQAISLGKWSEIKKAHDEIYHLYMVLYTDKGMLYTERNETPILSTGKPAETKETQKQVITLTKPITVGEMVDKTVKRVGLDKFVRYDSWKNNCQVYVKDMLSANGLWTEALNGFVLQDTRKMAEEFPSLGKRIGQAITDVAGAGRRLAEEVALKRGGKVRRRFIH